MTALSCPFRNAQCLLTLTNTFRSSSKYAGKSASTCKSSMARKEAIDWMMSPARSISSVLMQICPKGKKALHCHAVTKHLADSPSRTVFPTATEAQSSSFYQKAKLLHEQALHQFQWGLYSGLGQRDICAYRTSAKVTGNLCASNYASLKLLLCANKYLLQICKLGSFLH